MITSYSRGHKIYYNTDTKKWHYLDDDSECKGERPCKKCGRYPTKEGYDACLGHIDGAISACCGHGVEEPYVIKEVTS